MPSIDGRLERRRCEGSIELVLPAGDNSRVNKAGHCRLWDAGTDIEDDTEPKQHSTDVGVAKSNKLVVSVVRHGP